MTFYKERKFTDSFQIDLFDFLWILAIKKYNKNIFRFEPRFHVGPEHELAFRLNLEMLPCLDPLGLLVC